MKKSAIFYFAILLLSCNKSSDNNAKADTSNTDNTKAETLTNETSNENENPVDIKSLFSLSPLSVFDETTEGLSLAEKNDLLKKGESDSWKISDESKAKLTVKSKNPSSEVTFRFFKKKDNSDGVLFTKVVNESNNNVHFWNYSHDSKTLNKASVITGFSANDFVSEEDKLPDSYKPVLHYQPVDDQTIEVLLHTWMDKEFENREIANKVFLKWNGEKFESKIVENEKIPDNNKFGLLDKSDYDISQLSHKGKTGNKKFWKDINGENIVLFSKTQDELFVYHYVVNSDNAKELRKIYDFEKDCEFDLTLGFINESIKITDLDNNNIGEITFAYEKACISDVSPKELKLIMLEDGDKFIIRGHNVVDLGGEKIGGDKKIDPSFKDAPVSFLSHANKIWDSIKE